MKHLVQSMEVVFVVINGDGGTEGTPRPQSQSTFFKYTPCNKHTVHVKTVFLREFLASLLSSWPDLGKFWSHH